MKLLNSIIAVLILCSVPFTVDNSNNKNNDIQEHIEIRFQPDSVVYVYENKGPEMSKQLYSVVLQNMAFVNMSDEPIILNTAAINAVKDDTVMQSQIISNQKIKESASKFNTYQEQGALDLYDFQFQTSRYLKDVRLATNDTLQSGEAIIIMHETLLFDYVPDELIVSINGTTLKNKKVSNSKALKVVNYKSKNSYVFPLRGSWFTAAGPSLISHHRWGSIQEFAFDFIKIGKDQLTYKSNGENLTDYYAYGQPIYAIGDGVVVSTMDEISESSDNVKKSSETESEYLERVKSYQEELMRKGFKYIFGNHIVIRHENNEHSSYFHLKHGSVAVKKGDRIKQGQLIAELGHSGNSTEPHLHFHISNGENIAYSRSLPVEFDNIILFPADNGNVRHLHSGQSLKTKN